ncbi:MAG TPA: hypothetical protein VGF76_01735 [Polyangiaceae bacterium]|nr:hypothetical protein [Polyangiaceae bacterium]
MINKSVICLAALLIGSVAIPGCSSGGAVPSSKSDSTSTNVDANTGSIGLDLTIAGGVVLSTVHYHVTGNGITPIDGDIPVDASGATASLLLRLPAGMGYTVTFSSTDSTGNTTCTGTATFDVTAGATNGVTVPLTCGTATTRGNTTFNGTFNTCPDISQLVIAPLALDVGGQINVSADATDVDMNTLTFAWTATGGSFVDATAKTTKYNCSAGGPQTLTVSVSDGQGCVTTQTAQVSCTTAAICGDGVVGAGEACDPPAAGTCDAHCQIITPHCGDGFVQTGEQCDPPNGTTCDATCQNVVCGDGKVSGSEQCEPPNTATCNATCGNRTAVCGDGFITAPETCDPSAAGSGPCDTTCHPIDACSSCTGTNCSDLAAGCVATTDHSSAASTASSCDTVLACITSTGCAKGSTRQAAECYCGSVDNTTCFGFNANAPQGLCKAVMDAAVPGGPLAVGAAFFDTTTGLGSAVQETVCRQSFCSGQCNL